jgi:hypothetical protein
MLLAAPALAQPCIAAIVLVGCTIAAILAPREGQSRWLLSGVLALILAAPGLYPLAQSLSFHEAEHILVSVRPAELLPFALGLVLAAFGPLLFLRLAERPSRGGRVVVAALATVATVLLLARVHGWVASGHLSTPMRAALLRVATETGPLAVVCAPKGVRDWVPALAKRAAGEPGPWIPPVYADEWALRSRRPCNARLETFLSER